jgi:hypothetical protein
MPIPAPFIRAILDAATSGNQTRAELALNNYAEEYHSEKLQAKQPTAFDHGQQLNNMEVIRRTLPINDLP